MLASPHSPLVSLNQETWSFLVLVTGEKKTFTTGVFISDSLFICGTITYLLGSKDFFLFITDIMYESIFFAVCSFFLLFCSVAELLLGGFCLFGHRGETMSRSTELSRPLLHCFSSSFTCQFSNSAMIVAFTKPR